MSRWALGSVHSRVFSSSDSQDVVLVPFGEHWDESQGAAHAWANDVFRGSVLCTSCSPGQCPLPSIHPMADKTALPRTFLCTCLSADMLNHSEDSNCCFRTNLSDVPTTVGVGAPPSPGHFQVCRSPPVTT